MKTSDVFKTTYGITLGFMCAKFTFTCGCRVIEKLCDVGLNKIDKVERNRKPNYKPYYTNEEENPFDPDKDIEEEEEKKDEVGDSE